MMQRQVTKFVLSVIFFFTISPTRSSSADRQEGPDSQQTARDLALTYTGLSGEQLTSLALRSTTDSTAIALDILTALTSVPGAARVWEASFDSIALTDWQNLTHQRSFHLIFDSTGIIFLAAYSYIAQPASAAESLLWKHDVSNVIPRRYVRLESPSHAPVISLFQALERASTGGRAFPVAAAARIEAYYLRCIWTDTVPRFPWLPTDTTDLWLVCKARYAPPPAGTDGAGQWDYSHVVVDATTGAVLIHMRAVPHVDRPDLLATAVPISESMRSNQGAGSTHTDLQPFAAQKAISVSGFPPRSLGEAAASGSSPAASIWTPTLRWLAGAAIAAPAWSVGFRGISLPDSELDAAYLNEITGGQRTRDFEVFLDSSATTVIGAACYRPAVVPMFDSADWFRGLQPVVPPYITVSLGGGVPSVPLAQALQLNSSVPAVVADRVEAYYLRWVWKGQPPRPKLIPADTVDVWLLAKAMHHPTTWDRGHDCTKTYWEYDCQVVDARTGAQLFEMTNRSRER